jgi:hypothetical protein
MKGLETKPLDAETEMQIAYTLDKIRTCNAGNERTARRGTKITMVDKNDNKRDREEAYAEAARLAFLVGTGEKVRRLGFWYPFCIDCCHNKYKRAHGSLTHLNVYPKTKERDRN